MKVRMIAAIPLIASLFASCITPAYRDKGFFHEDPSADRYRDDDPYADLHRARGKGAYGRRKLSETP